MPTSAGRAMNQAISRGSLIAKAQVLSQGSPYGHCVGRSGTGKRFFSSTSLFTLISDFRCDVYEMCTLLGYYAASCGNCLPTFRDNVSVPFSFLACEDGTISCPEKSVNNYHTMPRNIPEERRSLRYFPVSIIPPIVRIHSFIHSFIHRRRYTVLASVIVFKCYT
jgi:hypothetical protein